MVDRTVRLTDQERQVLTWLSLSNRAVFFVFLDFYTPN